MPKIQFDIDVCCDVCGEDLESDSRYLGDVMRVPPCPVCLENKEKEIREEMEREFQNRIDEESLGD